MFSPQFLGNREYFGFISAYRWDGITGGVVSRFAIQGVSSSDYQFCPSDFLEFVCLVGAFCTQPHISEEPKLNVFLGEVKKGMAIEILATIENHNDANNDGFISQGESFDIEFRAGDVEGNAVTGVNSNYLDVSFDSAQITVDDIVYNNTYSFGTEGTIDNDSGVVTGVGAFALAAPSGDSLSDLTPVFTLTVTALQDIPTDAAIVTTAPGSTATSQTTIIGSDGDLDGDTDNDGVLDDPDADSNPTFGTAVECYLTGTLIATDKGEQPVETLEIGDLVETAQGKLEPVKWVGHQTYDVKSEKPHPFRTYPILIKAGALGNNTPTRDLYVSPDHSLLINGLLINAGALTNDISIIQVEPENDAFVYHHVELEKHALILAEGVPSESYLPQKNERIMFDNYNEFEALYPGESDLLRLPMNYPRVSSKRLVPQFIVEQLTKIAYALYPQEAQKIA